MSLTATTVTHLCPSCSHLLTGRFCSHCGERRADHHDLSLKHQAEELLEGFTHFDNKFFRTVKLLVTKPGVLTRQFTAGVRVPYMKPFQLFIVCNLLFFFLQGKGNVFAQGLLTYYEMEPYRWFGTAPAVDKITRSGMAFETLAMLFNTQVVTQSKAWIFVFVPVLTLASALLFVHKRRFFAEHLIFATHFFSFIILFYIGVNFLVNKPFMWLSQQQYNETFDIVSSLLGLVLIMWYYASAATRFYNVGKVYATICGLSIGVVFFTSIYGYRMLLFYKIISGISL